MLSWFSRNGSKPSKPPPSRPRATEQQQPRTEVAPSAILKEKPTSQEPTHLTVASPAVVDAPPVATALTPERPQKATFTAALSTPHDAVLAELQGHPLALDLSARTDPTPSTSALGMQSIDTLPAAPSDVPGSIATSTSPPPDSLFDPFTGVPIGILAPASSPQNSGSSEDLWAHLTRIRSLQADVARLHLTMEGIGLGEAVAPRLPSTAPRAVGERLEDDDEISDGDGGAEAEKRRAREFERTEQGFDKRKEDIGQIMAKLGEVSQALAAFHALDTPMFNTVVASPTTLSSAPAPRPRPRPRPPLRRSDLHRDSLDASPRHEETFDSLGGIPSPLPIFEEPEGRAEHVLPDASAARCDRWIVGYFVEALACISEAQAIIPYLTI